MVSATFLENAKHASFFAPYFQKAQEEYEYLKNNFADSPEYLSGWFHNFCCPHCAAQLDFDSIVARHSFTGGNRYHCSACGKDAEGTETLDEAWVYAYRMKLAESLPAASLRAILGDGEALALIVRFVDFYADNYHLFPIHGKHAGKGKIMEQSLDEAVFILAVFRALFPVRDKIEPSKLATWKNKLFLPLCEFLLDQTGFHQIHNISLWMRSAVGVAALFMEDDALLRRATEPPYGIRAQVEKGYTKDGIWEECSFHYHYYSTEALTEFLLYYRAKAPNDPLFDTLANAYVVPAAFSHDGYSIPSLNDGWYPLSLERYAPQLVTAAQILHHPTVLYQLSVLKERSPESLVSTNALLYCAEILENAALPVLPVADLCTLFADSRLAVFRGTFTAILRAGICRYSHMHDDYLSLVIPAVSDDLGTPGYAHPMTDSYYRRSHAHNTLCMDGQSQPHIYRDTVISAFPNGVCAEADALWEGVDAKRVITLESGVLCDRLTVSSASSHVYDWFFHVQGKLISDADAPVSLPETDVTYEYLSDVRFWGEGKGRILSFETALGIFDVEICSDAKLFVAKSPANPAHVLRETVLLRVEAACAEFHVSYRLR